MLNKSKKELQLMSDHVLEERLDCLSAIRARIDDYDYVFEGDEPMIAMVQNEIDMIVDILESREL